MGGVVKDPGNSRGQGSCVIDLVSRGPLIQWGIPFFICNPPIEGLGFLRGNGESLKAVSVGVTVSFS